MFNSKVLVTVGASLLALACLPMASLHAELIGYWNFNGNVDDQSGMENHGELVGGVYSDEVPPAIGSGQSMSFEFDTDHVFVENADGVLDVEEFTLAMYIFDRGQVGALERLTSREGDTFETAINVHPPFNGEGQYAYYSGAGGGWLWADEVAALEEWQHVAYVANANEETMSIYVDGELVHESLDPWFTIPTGFMHIGNRHNDVEGFDGLMDDVAIWDEVLSAEDIMALSQNGVASFLNPVAGDLNGDGVCDAADIDAMTTALLGNDDASKFDLNGDGAVTTDDRTFLVKDIKQTWFGDADLNGEFNSTDFVVVFQVGEYEDIANGNSGWAEGDWNGDSEFNSSDFVTAFQDGGFEQGPLGAVQAVPEPGSFALIVVGLALLAWRRSR